MAHVISKPLFRDIGRLRIWVIPLRTDNYTYFVYDRRGRTGFVVDPSEGPPLVAFFREERLDPQHVLLTHHHDDHVGGAEFLRDEFGSQLVGAARERSRLPRLDLELPDEGRFNVLNFEISVVPCPGHTHHHLAYFMAQERILWSGDVLFGFGCGRVFEGSLEQMHHTLQKLGALLPEDYASETPDSDVSVFCGHEYTRLNLSIWQKIGNTDETHSYLAALEGENQDCTVPLSLRREKKYNPLMCADRSLFEERRKLRDRF